MKKYLTVLIFLFVSTVTISAQKWADPSPTVGQNASITYRNNSEYTMTLKIIKPYGGLYTIVTLYPHSSRTVQFSSTSNYSMKIKAVRNGKASYHDGGMFSVTCNNYEWAEGVMEFKLSTYGSGLGPTISEREFESNN